MSSTSSPNTEIGFIERFAEGEIRISNKIYNKLKDKRGPIDEMRADNAHYAIEHGSTEHLVKRRLRRIGLRALGVIVLSGALIFPIQYIKEEVLTINNLPQPTKSNQ